MRPVTARLLLLLLALAQLLAVACAQEPGADSSSIEDAIEDEDAEDEEEDVDGDSEVKEENGVLVLNDSNFDTFVADRDTVLLEFYAPWCGHCKQFAPKYEKIAETLKGDDPPIPVAKIDATTASTLAGRFDVNGYPTIKILKKGQAVDYEGARTQEEIVAKVREVAQPTWTPPPEATLVLTAENFDSVVDEADIILVEFYAPCLRALQWGRGRKWASKGDPTEPEETLSWTPQTPGSGAIVVGFRSPTCIHSSRFLAPQHLSGRSGWGGPRHLRNMVDSCCRPIPPSANSLREDYKFHHTFSAEIAKFLKVTPGKLVVMQPERFQSRFEPKSHVMDVQVSVGTGRECPGLETWDFPILAPFPVCCQGSWRVVVLGERTPLLHVSESVPCDSRNGNPTARNPCWTAVLRHPPPAAFGCLTTTKQSRKLVPSIRIWVVILAGGDEGDGPWQVGSQGGQAGSQQTLRNTSVPPATQFWRSKVLEVAKDFPEYTFAIADEEDYASEVKDLGLGESGEDVNAAVLDEGGRRFAMEPTEFDADALREFVTAFKEGKLKPVIKSQPVPKNNKGPVKVVVGKTFEDIVLDPSKDVLIEFYAPWCGHCKQLEPVYTALGKKYRSHKGLVIAKMDATANEATSDHYKVDGFPTIYFAPSGDKQNPIRFEGADRDLEHLSQFIEEHATQLGRAKEEL
nr:protein disulfide-isomerase A4 [Loxodonta africana]